MKLTTYSRDGSISCGILTGDGLIDIVSAFSGENPPRSVKEILERGPACLERLAALEKSGADVLALDSVKLLAPIPRPGKILALAGNYTEHIKEGGGKLGLAESPRATTVPRPFIMPSTAVANPGDEIPWAAYSETIDYELELAVVIGAECKAVSIDDAPDMIAGYTIVNDVSARTVTFKKNRAERPWDEFYDWLNGKWGDGFCPMGPYVLTAGEIDDVQNLDLEMKINGQVRQSANTSQMIHTVAQIVSFLSNMMTLEPGDVIATGTPSGVGFPTGNFLKAGDVIEASIEKLGTLKNTFGPKPAAFYEPLV
ncbi:MAG: fumarylacetoacetate hydrolase family protein [Planctomycetota bacterium]|jgi:2-keto-4-pentenoate hydratase/2-oxohepta-3-ene-1,7-dioic acid hydratase in catechol pathway